VHRPRRSPSLFATPTSSRTRGQGSRPRWVRDTAFSLRGRSRRAATLGPRYGALAQRQVGARGGAGSAIRRSRSVGGRGARPRSVRDTAFSLNGGSRRAGTLGLPTSVLANVGPVLGSWRSFTRLALRVHSLPSGTALPNPSLQRTLRVRSCLSFRGLKPFGSWTASWHA
jgi:hypothetical protein